MQFLILIFMEFLLILATIILRLLLALLYGFILMILLLQILKHFLLLLQLLILKLLVTLLLDFILIVRGYLRGPPYTTAPPCNAWGNAPVDDS